MFFFCLLSGGYGYTLFSALRQFGQTENQQFPLTLGKDFSGTVVDTGKAVFNLKPGDQVCLVAYCLVALTMPFVHHHSSLPISSKLFFKILHEILMDTENVSLILHT